MEGRQLQQIVRRGGKSDRLIVKWWRAMVVLASAGGNDVAAIAGLVQTSPDRVQSARTFEVTALALCSAGGLQTQDKGSHESVGQPTPGNIGVGDGFGALGIGSEVLGFDTGLFSECDFVSPPDDVPNLAFDLRRFVARQH